MRDSGPERVELKPVRGVAGVGEGCLTGPKGPWLEKTTKYGDASKQKPFLNRKRGIGLLKTFTTAFSMERYSAETLESGRPN